MNLLKMALSFCLLVFASQAMASVWESTAEWNQDSEKEFADFIQNKVTVDIFSSRRSPYYGISTDCADAVYTLRVIFAHDHQLQFAMKNPRSPRELITSDMDRWDNLPVEQRFIKFVNYVKDMGTSQSLIEDTYPIAINKTYVTAGTVFLNPILGNVPGLMNDGHSEYVQSIESTGYISFLSSTVPAAVRRLNVTLVNTLVPQVTTGGFRRFMQPAFYGMKLSELPGYSTEQFRMGHWQERAMDSRQQIFEWHEAIRNRLRDRVASPEEVMGYLIENICTLLKTRVTAVDEAAARLQGHSCLDPQSAEYDDLSTPSRDSRIFDNYALLEELLKIQDSRSDTEKVYDALRSSRGAGSSPITSTINVETYDMGRARSGLEQCNVEYMPGQTMNAYELYKVTKSGHLESNPNYSIPVRWGIPESGNTKLCH